jgi:hypothetical protein
MSTWDRCDLTLLVFLCHEARIRLEVEPAGPHMLRLNFWQRSHNGGISERHPSLDEALQKFQDYLPLDHRVRYENRDSEVA